MPVSTDNARAVIGDYRGALYDCNPATLLRQLRELCNDDCDITLAHPLGPVRGPDALHATAFAPLLNAIPDLERRDYIVVGAEDRGEQWICCGGYYTGVFEKPWLHIPATKHVVTMRYKDKQAAA